MSAPSNLPSPPNPTRRFPTRRLFASVAAGIALVAATPFGVEWVAYRWTHSITNDAFVESHLVNLAPQVPGHMVEILVEEHDSVEAGQLLARIDPVPYQRQVELAEAKLSVAEAAVRQEQAALERLTDEWPLRVAVAEKEEAVAREDEYKARKFLEMTTRDVDKGIRAAEAAVDAARAVLVHAEEDYQRYSRLYEEQSVPQQRFEDATKAYKTAQAGLAIAEAKLARAEAARNQVDIAHRSLLANALTLQKSQESVKLARLGKLQVEESQRQVKVKQAQVQEARRQLDLARTNLAYTRVVAPFAGVVVKRYRNLGDYLPAGASILALYNPELVYVTAHLEETRLEGVIPGSPVRVDVDAFRSPFQGRVLWVGQATGANFSLVPRDVSSGEFTRIVQRVPVRIYVERDERWPLLRPGLSATVAIAHGPGDPEWARRAAAEQRALESAVAPRKEPAP